MRRFSWTRQRGLAGALLLSACLHAFAYFTALSGRHPGPEPLPIARYEALLPPVDRLAAEAPAATKRPSRSTDKRATTPSAARAAPPLDPAESVPPSLAAAEPPATAERVETPATADPVLANTPPPQPPPVAMETVPPAAASSFVPPLLAERIAIDYKMTSSITDGVAHLRWNRRGDVYEIDSSIQATGFLVSVFAGVVHQQSRGTVTTEGLQPQAFSMRRGEGEADTADFRYAEKALVLKRGGNIRAVPLAQAMQDTQSFLFQLAIDAARQIEADIRLDVIVTNGRKVYRQQFRRIGEEVLKLAWGNVTTLHLASEAANPEDTYEVWLAPAHAYLPVKLRFHIGRFPVEQLAVRLGMSGDDRAEAVAPGR